jgi:periplasmic protein CpxP/Spy
MRFTCRLVLAGIFLMGADRLVAKAQQSSTSDQPSEGFTGGHRPLDVESELSHLTSELDLTPEQQNQIKPILVEHQQKERALRADHSLSADELRTRAHAISDETHKQIETLLTDDQKEKAKAMRMHRRGVPPSTAPASTPEPQGISDPTLDIAR